MDTFDTIFKMSYSTYPVLPESLILTVFKKVLEIDSNNEQFYVLVTKVQKLKRNTHTHTHTHKQTNKRYWFDSAAKMGNIS